MDIFQSVIDLKPFIPSKDFKESAAFYKDLGFEQNWESEGLREFQAGDFRFLLQDYYVPEWAENCMLFMWVENTDDWWTHIESLKLTEKYPGVQAKEPELQPWGIVVLYLIDPSGVLWHIAQAPEEEEENE